MQGSGLATDRIVSETKREFSKFKSGEDELRRSSKSSRKLVWISSRRGDDDDDDDDVDDQEAAAAAIAGEQRQSGGSSEQGRGSRSYSFKMGVSQRRIRGNRVMPPQCEEQTATEVLLNKKVETRPAQSSQSVLDSELFHAVENGDSALVKLLHAEGASVESVNSEGMTPLMLACTDEKLFDTALTLLRLGANVKAYRGGAHGGYALHHAAVMGLTSTVALLLSYAADALLPNDDGQTPLDIARERRHVAVVRIIEDWICFFGGFLREIHSDGIGKKVTYKKICLSVGLLCCRLPQLLLVRLGGTSSPCMLPRKWVLLFYTISCFFQLFLTCNSRQVAKPHAVVLLGSFTSDIQPDFNSRNPELIVTDKVTKSTFRFRAEVKGDSEQLKRLYSACMQQVGEPLSPYGCSHFIPCQGQQLKQAAVPEEEELPSEDTDEVELAKAIDASIESALREGVPFSQMVQLHLQAKKQLCKQQVAAAVTQVAAVPSRPRPPPLPVRGVTAPAAPAVAAEGPQCIICMDAAEEAACVPCGHGGCLSCLSLLESCPVCRSHVFNVLKN